jgi:hypothetical protein
VKACAAGTRRVQHWHDAGLGMTRGAHRLATVEGEAKRALLGQKWSWAAEIEGGRGGLAEKTREHGQTSADGLGAGWAAGSGQDVGRAW